MVQQRPRTLRLPVSAISRRLLASTLGASMLVAGCEAGQAEPEAEDDVAFGLGGKADSTCPAEEPLC